MKSSLREADSAGGTASMARGFYTLESTPEMLLALILAYHHDSGCHQADPGSRRPEGL